MVPTAGVLTANDAYVADRPSIYPPFDALQVLTAYTRNANRRRHLNLIELVLADQEAEHTRLDAVLLGVTICTPQLQIV
jgi:hypothetical protein